PTVMSKAYVNQGILFNNAAEVHSS
ncbi:metal ABC transporter ATP-binding protein, partial [Bacillus sp. Gnz1/3]